MPGQITVFTTMKNEGPYMLEWIAFHRMLGVDHFLIYTNDCEDGTDDIARRLEALGIATHVENPIHVGGNPQHKMLRRARNHPKVTGAEWLLCMDVDEFWNIRCGDGGFRDAIEAVEEAAGREVDAISFAWKLFGTSGNRTFEDRPVLPEFTSSDSADSYHSSRASGLKTLFRNNGVFTRFGPHRPKGMDEDTIGDVAWSDAGGNLFPAADVGWRAWPGFDHRFGRINHYSVRSLEGFLVKRDRGRTNHIYVEQAESYWRDMNVNAAEDRTILPAAERAEPLRAELMADPELGRLHRDAFAWHASKIEQLKQRAEWGDFRNWLEQNLV